MSGIRSGQLGAMVSANNLDGGTGIYLAKGFVHADTVRPRVWRGYTQHPNGNCTEKYHYSDADQG